MAYAIVRHCVDDYFALEIMQVMLDNGMNIVSVTCDPSMKYNKYAIWGVRPDLGKQTIEEFCVELDKAIDKMYNDYEKRKKG